MLELISSQGVTKPTSWEEVVTALEGLSDNELITLATPKFVLSLGVATPGSADNPTLEEKLATVEYRASEDPPYFTVAPSSSEKDERVVVFRFGGQWTEIARRNCLPMQDLLLVVKHFYYHNCPPSWIEWEET